MVPSKPWIVQLLEAVEVPVLVEVAVELDVGAAIQLSSTLIEAT
jgi:hydrogenase-4 membrane subunit HyfE